MGSLYCHRDSCLHSCPFIGADDSTLRISPIRRYAAFQSRPCRKLQCRSKAERNDRSGIAVRERCWKQEGIPAPQTAEKKDSVSQIAYASSLLWLLSQLPANAEGLASTTDFSKGSFSTESYIVTLGLFLISLPGLWSQIKRAPKASIKRNTFETEGPKKAGQDSLDKRARQIFLYFKKYNYEVKETGDTITFQGTYEASKGQAAALVFYVFCGLLSTGLVLSIALPFGGSNWYWLAALSPLSGVYYWQRGTRNEQFKVKMVTSDDEMTTDILVEGDKEEIERMRDELALWEKGKVKVKGLLEK